MPKNSRCPDEFRMDFVSLAVPVTFGPMEKYSNGKNEIPYIRLGRTGGFDLDLREYDQAYVLRLITCCKVSK
ncbi:hypothetical protein RB195_019072 [Necator americanus]